MSNNKFKKLQKNTHINFLEVQREMIMKERDISLKRLLCSEKYLKLMKEAKDVDQCLKLFNENYSKELDELTVEHKKFQAESDERMRQVGDNLTKNFMNEFLGF